MSELKDFDPFWLEKGQELVNNTFTNLNKHLINYNTYLKFLLGFYTTAGLTTVLLFKSVCPWIYIGFFLPLILVYWALFKISVGQSISLDSLDIRSPLKINDTYNKLVINLKKDIVSAKQWVGLATFAVLIGCSTATYYLNLEIKEADKEKVLKDAEQKRSEDLLKIENEIYKDFKKGQKLHIEVNEKDQKLIITAKLLEDKTIAIEYIDTDDKTQNRAFEIPKWTDYKRDIDNVKELIKIKD